MSRADGKGWSAVRTADGSWTLRDEDVGQACHSLAGAWTEALERYVMATRLRERADQRLGAARRRGGRARLCLLDVGTGVGWNLAAAELVLAPRPIELEVHSLESRVGVLHAALELPAEGPLAEDARRRAWLRAALESAAAGGGAVEVAGSPLAGARIRLLLGDARQTLPRLAPGPRYDAVLFDPFSPSCDPPLWSADFLRGIAERMAPEALLSTYSASLGVRAALVSSGLRVGPGPRVGHKAQGTLASLDAELEPLDARTARKLGRRLAGGPPAAGLSRPVRTDSRQH